MKIIQLNALFISSHMHIMLMMNFSAVLVFHITLYECSLCYKIGIMRKK